MAETFTSFSAAGTTGVSPSPCVRRGGNDGRVALEDTPFPPYVHPLLHRECAIEFVDWRWLCSHCLDSDSAALEYFYLSPFYAQRDSFSHARQETLNERMRRGEHTNTQGFDISQQQGLLFSVTYSNLSDLRKQAPHGVLTLQERELEKLEAEKNEEKNKGAAGEKEEKEGPSSSSALLNIPKEENKDSSADFVARCNYFNANAIFHITLFRREPARHGAMLTLPLRVYAVIGGKIYRMAPLMEILQQKMASAMHRLERCFDLLQLGLVRWDLNEGYVWWARLPQDGEEGNKMLPSSRKHMSVRPLGSVAPGNVTSKSCGPAGAEQHQGKSSIRFLDEARTPPHSSEKSVDMSADAENTVFLPRTKQTSGENIPTWMRRSTEWVEEDGCLVKEVFKKTHCEVASRVLAAEQKRLALEMQNLVEKRKRNEEEWKSARELEVALAAAVNKKLVLYRQHKSEQLKRVPFSQQLRVLQALQTDEQEQAQRLTQHAAKVSAEA